MAIEYKMLTEKELNTFINMRINQLREEGAKEEIDLVPALKDYYTRHMADGTFVSWLALDGKKYYWDKWNVICGEAALFWMSKWKDRIVIQYVYRTTI